jgi:hypothetical protein
MSSKSGNTKSEAQNYWYLWFVAAAALGTLMVYMAFIFNAQPIVLYAGWLSLGLWAIGVIGGLNAERKQGRQTKE